MEPWRDEGGWTLRILVCSEEEAPGCIKQDLLTHIDPGVFEHDFPPTGPSRWMLIPLLCTEDSMISSFFTRGHFHCKLPLKSFSALRVIHVTMQSSRAELKSLPSF